jgi:shikimate dehydrogenase
LGPVISVFDWSERHDALAGAAMLVNSTDQGMHGKTDLDVRLDALPTDALVCDAIYIPLETSLLANARLRGNLTVNGLGMLLNQARPAFKAWFGVDPALTNALREVVIATF